MGSVPSSSGHAIAYRWRSLPTVRRYRASKPQGSSERVLPWQVTMDQFICASLSHTHYWYEVGMLKVPVYSAIDPYTIRALSLNIKYCNWKREIHLHFTTYLYGLSPTCTVVVVFVVVSHIQRIGCQPEKTTLHGGQSRSWSADSIKL